MYHEHVNPIYPERICRNMAGWRDGILMGLQLWLSSKTAPACDGRCRQILGCYGMVQLSESYKSHCTRSRLL